MGCRGPEPIPILRARILELHGLRWSLGEISLKHGIPRSTVQYTITKARERAQDYKLLSRPGAPRVITEDQRDAIYEKTQAQPDITYKQLQAQEAPDAHFCTIRRLLREMHLKRSNRHVCFQAGVEAIKSDKNDIRNKQ